VPACGWLYLDPRDGLSEQQFVCAFCGKNTEDDPRYVRIDLTWTHSLATQHLGAHMACLEAALRPGFPWLTVSTDRWSPSPRTYSGKVGRFWSMCVSPPLS
jgi:hypothetical protein